jgi:hypothetical protein
MRLKLAVLTVYALVIIAPAALMARTRVGPVNAGEPDNLSAPAEQLDYCSDVANEVRKLDLRGKRGMVCFRHKTHEAYLNPDAGFAHQSVQGAACIGCHHKKSEVTGVPILARCTVCHRRQGDPRNPKNREFDEVFSERAYHDLCIGCHRASNEKKIAVNKAPVACSECHRSKLDGSGG